MREHRYMAQNLGRRTWLKGTFTGRFVGRLDPYHSDARHERFFDMEVTEGEIVARQDQVMLWPNEGDREFEESSSLQVKLPGRIAVCLHYLDGSVKHFMVDLKEIRLLRCGLSDKVYHRDEVHGTIRGEVCAYLLHRDTVMNEIKEKATEKESERPSPAKASLVETTSFSTRPATSLNLRNLFLFPMLTLLVAALLVSDNRLPVTGFFLLGASLVLWQYSKGLFRARARRLVAIGMYCLFFSIGLGWVLSQAFGTPRKSNAKITSLLENGDSLLAAKNFSQALLVYDALADQDSDEKQTRFKRALCNVGLGKIREAVADLKPLLQVRYAAAVRLHDSINPMKRRQIGTQIRCRDGWVSNSKNRRGTCSGHGGVENWEEPVYEEYRVYN